MATPVKLVQTPAVALYSPISAAATSLTIAPYPVDLDGVKLTMSDFGTTGYMTVDPKVSGYEEIISFTGLTDNGNNTATLTGLTRDLQSKYPYTGSGTGKAHGSSAVVVFSNNPQVVSGYANKANDETITGQWTFSVFPITPATPLATTVAAGFVQIATQAQLLAKTATGGTGASLVAPPNLIPNVLTSDYKIDTGTANAFAIAPAPAITAYVTGQQFSFKALNANTGPCTLNVNALGTKTIKLSTGADVPASGILAGQVVVVEYDGVNFQMLTPLGSGVVKYGGTGADGALTITSGTTTVSAASAAVLVKNYTSISITGTGVLAFSNPNTNGTTIILKSQGNVTLTSSATPMIDVSNMGAAGGAAVGPSVNQPGNNGTDGYGLGLFKTNKSTAGAAGAAGTNGTTPTFDVTDQTLSIYAAKYPWICPGAGGSSGGISSGTGTYTSGAASPGGGALIIECGGSLNFTTTNGISASSAAGGNAVINSAGNTNAGGGGPGGAGTVLITYNVLIAASGTITVAPGAVGTGAASGGSPTTSVGAIGGSLKATGVGFALVTANTEFA